MSASKQDAKFGEPSPEEVQGSGGRLRTRREQTTLYYRLSAVLFVGGGLSGIPPDLLQAPRNSSAILILPVIAILSAIVTWAVSERAPRAGQAGVVVSRGHLVLLLMRKACFDQRLGKQRIVEPR